jgi:hypothetical protein
MMPHTGDAGILTARHLAWISNFTGIKVAPPGASASARAPNGAAAPAAMAPGAAAPGAAAAAPGAAPPPANAPAPAGAGKSGSSLTLNASHASINDANGVGHGLNASANAKVDLGGKRAIDMDFTAGCKIQVDVKQAGTAEKPKFHLATTISFDLSGGADGKADAGGATVTASAKGSAGGMAKFTRELNAADAKVYLETLKSGKAGDARFPEYQVVATGVAGGGQAAKDCWDQLSGSTADLKPGEAIETSIHVKGGVSGGVSGKTGDVALSAKGGVSGDYKIELKREALDETHEKVTAVIDRGYDANAALAAEKQFGAALEGKKSHHGGETVEFVFDKTDRVAFAANLKLVQQARSAEALDKLAKGELKAFARSTTERESSGGGVKGAVTSHGASADVSAASNFDHMAKRDNQGHVLEAHTKASNETAHSEGYGDKYRVGEKNTEGMNLDVRDDQTSGELYHKKEQHRLKDAANAFIDHPSKILKPKELLEQTKRTDVAFTKLNNDDARLICQSAHDERTWASYCGGKHQAAWIETGKQIRAASQMQNGQLVKVDPAAVNKALGQFVGTLGDERVNAIEAALRPISGKNHAFGGTKVAFPHGTDLAQKLWHDAIDADPVAAAKEKAKTDPKGALGELMTATGNLSDLLNELRDNDFLWSQHESVLNEMRQTVVEHMNAADAAMREVKQLAAAPAGNGAPSHPGATHPGQQQHQHHHHHHHHHHAHQQPGSASQAGAANGAEPPPAGEGPEPAPAGEKPPGAGHHHHHHHHRGGHGHAKPSDPAKTDKIMEVFAEDAKNGDEAERLAREINNEIFNVLTAHKTTVFKHIHACRKLLQGKMSSDAEGHYRKLVHDISDEIEHKWDQQYKQSHDKWKAIKPGGGFDDGDKETLRKKLEEFHPDGARREFAEVTTKRADWGEAPIAFNYGGGA